MSPQFMPYPPPRIDGLPQPPAAGSQGSGSWIMGVVGNLLGRAPVGLILTLALLVLGRVALQVFGNYFSVLNAPAPAWVGLFALAMPMIALVVYCVLRLLSPSTRRSRYWTARTYGGGSQGGPGGGSYGDGSSPFHGW
jgi:hypothetical protein